MNTELKARVVAAGAAIAILAFAVVWLILSIELMRFKPTTTTPLLTVNDFQIGLASLLATSVATTTAAYLGISIVKPETNGLAPIAAGSWVAKVKALLARVFTKQKLLAAGLLTYPVVAVFVVIVTFANASEAPDIFKVFSYTAAGWVLGCAALVLAPDTN